MEKDINRLIYNNRQFLYKRARHIAPNRDAALDLAQDTILRILEQEAKFDRNQSFRIWSAQVMRNLYINQYNRRKRYRVFATDTKDLMPLVKSVRNNGEANLGVQFLEKAMSKLKRPHKKAFQMFFEGYNQKEIAQEFQIPVGTVKYHIFEARRVLQKLVNQDKYLTQLN